MCAWVIVNTATVNNIGVTILEAIDSFAIAKKQKKTIVNYIVNYSLKLNYLLCFSYN